MSLRILHTADNHIGLSFNQYPEAARERLIDERFPEGTLPSALLQALLTDQAHPGDAHLALDIIETVSKS